MILFYQNKPFISIHFNLLCKRSKTHKNSSVDRVFVTEEQNEEYRKIHIIDNKDI